MWKFLVLVVLVSITNVRAEEKKRDILNDIGGLAGKLVGKTWRTIMPHDIVEGSKAGLEDRQFHGTTGGSAGPPQGYNQWGPPPGYNQWGPPPGYNPWGPPPGYNPYPPPYQPPLPPKYVIDPPTVIDLQH